MWHHPASASLIKGLVGCAALSLIVLPAAATAQDGGVPAATPEATRHDAATADEGEFEEVWMAVQVNGVEMPESALLLRRRQASGAARMLARRADLDAWRLVPPATAGVAHADDTFVALDAFAGLTYHVDDARMLLSITAAPRLFHKTELGGREQAVRRDAAPPARGGFLNYDAYVSRASEKTQENLMLEFGAFNRFGAGTSSYAVRSGHQPSPVTRMNSTWTVDSLARRASLRVGDAVSAPGAFGGSSRFAGVQWATNTATQPGFSSLYFPEISGEAATPSALDVYVNDMLRMRTAIPTGPFTIHEIPLVTGQGEAKVVVRDAQGNEQEIRMPFQVNPSLLKPGLQDYSYSWGFLRRDYGQASNRYGRWLGSLTHRVGITRTLTGETHADWMRERQTLGLTAVHLQPWLGLISLSVAASRAPQGTGRLSAAAVSRQFGNISVGVQRQRNDARFVLGGEQVDTDQAVSRTQFFTSFHRNGIGSLALSYQNEERASTGRRRAVNGAYSFALGRLAYCSVSWFRATGRDAIRGAALMLSLPLEDGTHSSLTSTSLSGRTQTMLQAQHNLPAGDGTGYRLQAGPGRTDPREAQLQMQNPHGRLELTAGQVAGNAYLQANASGSVATMDGRWFLGRRIPDSFAVVEVPGYSGIHVYVDNQRVAKTGEDGFALLPNLRPFHASRIHLDPVDLPLDAAIEDTRLQAAPGYRAGQSLRFPVRHAHAALLTVLLDDGSPLPLGASVRLNDDAQEFPVGRSGLVYLTGLQPANTVRIGWHAHQCEISVAYAESEDPLPHLGRFVCAGVKP